MSKEMLINTVKGQECRIAVVDGGQLEELYIERASSASHVGNIYKGRITNVEPSIQAAFIDFGLAKNGFLHISDVTPQYFPRGQRAMSEPVGRKRAHRDRPPIQECLRRGQEVIVQLTKEGIGTKGPTLTTYLSIPGRLLVMMPGMSRLGVSRKIENDEIRSKARAILAELSPPSDTGFIVRTAAIGHAKRDFQRDLNYLLRLWKSVKKRIQTTKAPAEVYQESDLVTRTLRDVYNTEIDRVICDDEEVARTIRGFLDVALPRTRNRVEFYVGKEGLFHDYGLEQEIEKIYSRRVELPSGGSLVIDQAEALVAIDVNSGRFRQHSDAETNALKVNLEAAREAARQLRLRDMGGVVVIDFIDMRQEKNRRAVEKALRDEIRDDRAKTKILKMSAFGIVEMTRQRVRPSLKHSIYRTCWHCDGSGLVKSEESQALWVMRNLQRIAAHGDIAEIHISATPVVEAHLTNHQRRELADLEARSGKRVILRSDASLAGDEVRIVCLNSRGNEVAWERTATTAPKAKIETTPVVEGLPEAQEEELSEELPADRPAEAGAPPEQQPPEPVVAESQAQSAAPGADAAATEQPQAQPTGKRRRRRGGRKHRKRREKQLAAQAAAAAAQAGAEPQSQQPETSQSEAIAIPVPTEPAPSAAEEAVAASREAAAPDGVAPEPPAEATQMSVQTAPPLTDQPVIKKTRRRGRRGGRKHKRKNVALPSDPESAEHPSPTEPPAIAPEVQRDIVDDDEEDDGPELWDE